MDNKNIWEKMGIVQLEPYEYKPSRKEVIEMRIVTTVILVISISLIVLILVLSERRSARIELQSINEKTLNIAPNSSTENKITTDK